MSDVAPDGSPVELYALLPDRAEGALVARVLKEGGSVLELGCGTGRITRQLVACGYRVTAVDESADMLAFVRGAETVHARIEGLALGRRFDAALLASNLVSAPPPQRLAFLETCRDHSDVAIIETLPLGWTPSETVSTLGAVSTRVVVERVENGTVHGAVYYAVGDRRWTHDFAMHVFVDEHELCAALSEAGLRLDHWLDRARGWFVATHA
ncbi:MAG TPA: class I SAM-dependent methyltransferase [Gaiellaceae bacterium]|nr:class I SAM-dependent methyltransferase [Gaiellaceae bacterium]